MAAALIALTPCGGGGSSGMTGNPQFCGTSAAVPASAGAAALRPGGN